MRFIGQCVSSTVLVTMGWSLILGIQWLGWNGPDWIRIPLGPKSDDTMLSPLIIGPALTAAVWSFVAAVRVWICSESPKAKEPSC